MTTILTLGDKIVCIMDTSSLLKMNNIYTFLRYQQYGTAYATFDNASSVVVNEHPGTTWSITRFKKLSDIRKEKLNEINELQI